MSDLINNLYSKYNEKYNEKYFSMALIYFRLLTNEKSNNLQDSSKLDDNFKNNPIATEWPSERLNYLSKFSALLSDSEINFDDPNKVHICACVPIQHTVTRRTWKEANECSFTLAQEDFPFDPSKIRVATVYLFQGVSVNNKLVDEIKLRQNIKDFSEALLDGNDGKYPIDIVFNNLKNINFGDSITLRDYSLKFAGFVDNISTNITTSGRTVDFACRDIVGMMLDQTVGQEEFNKIAESMRDGTIESVVRQVLSFANAGKGLIIHGIGFPSNNIKFPKNEAQEVVKKNSKSRINKDMSYWDLVVDLCQLCGLTCQVEYLQYQKDIISDVGKNYIAVPSLAIYTADIAYGSTKFSKDKLLGKEFYNINGVNKDIPENEGYYYWFNSRPLIEIGFNGSEATITKDIGAGLIPAVRVIAFDGEDLVEDWFPEKMYNKVPGDMTLTEYNKKIKHLQAIGIKYFDSKAWKEITIPGIHYQKDCKKIAENLYNQMVRGSNKLTIKSSRYYFSSHDEDAKKENIIGIGNIRCGHAVDILWPGIINMNDSEFYEDSDFINLNNIDDQQKDYFLTINSEKKLIKVWYVSSVEYTLDPEGFSISIELINSLEVNYEKKSI